MLAINLKKECESLTERNRQLTAQLNDKQQLSHFEVKPVKDQSRIATLEHENATLLRLVERLQQEEVRKLRAVEAQLKRWVEAVSILGHDGTPPTPLMVARHLTECESIRRQKDQLLLENEGQIERLRLQLENEQRQRIYAEMRLEGEEAARQAAEVAVALLTGQLDIQKELLLALKKELYDEEAVSRACIAIENAKSQSNVLEDPVQRLQMVMDEFRESMAEWADTVAMKDEKLLTIQDNYHKLEMLLEDTTRAERSLRAKLEDQRSFIQALQQKLSDVASSVMFHEQIEKERQRATQLLETSKRFYLKEAQTLRALVKAILGWSLYLERNNDELAISLVPVVGKHTDEKEAPGEIVLLTKADEERLAAENYTDADFNIHLTGSFADSWEAGGPWRDALLTRQSIPVFLAAHVLEVAAARH